MNKVSERCQQIVFFFFFKDPRSPWMVVVAGSRPALLPWLRPRLRGDSSQASWELV